MDKKFCPFIKDLCRDDCTFHSHNTAIGNSVHDCLIAIKLEGINDMEYDQLENIYKEVSTKE